MDDCYLVGPEGAVHAALQATARNVQQPGTDLRLVVRKTETWSPDAQVRERIAHWEVGGVRVPVGSRAAPRGAGEAREGEGEEQAAVTGVEVSGVPVGEPGYVAAAVRACVDRAVSKITKVHQGLLLRSRHTLLALVVYALQPLLDFHLQCLYPSESRRHMRRFDDAIADALAGALGREVIRDDIAEARLRLPVRMHGGGVRARASPWYAEVAFLGAVAMVVPRWRGQGGAATSASPKR